MHRIHGELLIGDRGSNIVELAASWAIVMFITGLYLVVAEERQWLGGYRLSPLGTRQPLVLARPACGDRLWVSFFVLFLLISGLPWAKSWGGLLKEVRQFGAHEVVKQDWTTGRTSELADRREMNTPAASAEDSGDHAEHAGHAGHNHSGMRKAQDDYSALDRLVATVQPLNLAQPVLISPPSKKSPDWSARSDAQIVRCAST